MSQDPESRIATDMRDVLQEVLDAVAASGGMVSDRDLPGHRMVGSSGRTIAFAKAQGCMRIAIEGFDLGLEIENEFARSVSGMNRGCVHWNALKALHACMDGTIPELEEDRNSKLGVRFTSYAPDEADRLRLTLEMGNAWVLSEDIKRSSRSEYTFALGNAPAMLIPPTDMFFREANDVVVDAKVLAAVSPTCQRLGMTIPSQADNVVTTRRKKGAPTRGYARLTRATSSLEVSGDDPVSAMRLLARVGAALRDRGIGIEDVATVHAKAVNEVDLTDAVIPRTAWWTWPNMVPSTAQHALMHHGIGQEWANDIAENLMKARIRAGHRTILLECRERNGTRRWLDAQPESPGWTVSFAQSTIDVLLHYGMLCESDGAIVPHPSFDPEIIAQAIGRGGEDGEVVCGIPLAQTKGWRSHSYGMIDLRCRPCFVERSEGVDHHEHQRKVMLARKNDPVIPAIRIGGAVWVDSFKMMTRNMPEMGMLPPEWRILAYPEFPMRWRMSGFLSALAAYAELYKDFDLSPYVDVQSPLSGILHVPARTNR